MPLVTAVFACQLVDLSATQFWSPLKYLSYLNGAVCRNCAVAAALAKDLLKERPLILMKDSPG